MKIRSGMYSRSGSLLLMVILLAGCGGGSGSATTNSTLAQSNSGQASASVSVSLSTTSSAVTAGSEVKLSWSASNAHRCSASGGWAGDRSPSGSETVGPLTQDSTFILSCSGTGDSASSQVSITIADISVGLNASPTYVEVGGFSTLNWEAVDVDSCAAYGGWQGYQPIVGVLTVGPIDVSSTYEISCYGEAGVVTATVSVSVVDRVLRWRPPTQNVDGSPLTDLAGYTIYWGLVSSDYTDSHRIDSAATTEWLVSMAPGSYYVAMKAHDSEGNESAYSDEILKVVP